MIDTTGGAVELLAALPTEDIPAVARLREQLAVRAADADLLDVAYRTIDSPLGSLLLATTERGLVRVAYEREDHDQVLDTLAEKISPRVLRSPSRLDDVSRELDEYFTGRRQVFDLPLDLRLSAGFRRTVLDHLREIGYGRTASYAAVAEAAGNPRAVRAAATACATNPLPVVVPCHRVIHSDGTVGRYVGGTEAKQALLALESAAA